jgi:cation diffusion facilitator CzcD-associated flavoprotein CzcO
VPSHLYSLSDAPNPGWTRLFPGQAEIQAYLQTLAAPFLRSGELRVGQRLVAAHWQAAESLWCAETEDGGRLLARDLVLAAGGLHHPAWPSTPGLDAFRGQLLHTARWPASTDLRGLRVGVIGTGASAAQVIPLLANRAEELHVAMRSPPWVLPRPDVGFPAWLRRAFERWPPLRLAFRGSVFLMLEVLAQGLLRPRTARWARWLGHRLRRRSVADPGLREALRPEYPIGCKRVLFSSELYPALCQPNTSVHTSAITAIEADGWRMADGRSVALDAIVCATGFQPLRLRDGLDLRGRNGMALAECWADRPAAHLGISTTGFPNLFFLLGPNTALGHNSVLYMIESQVRHVQALRRMRAERGALEVEPTATAQRAFLDQLDRRFVGTAWNGGCTSWYLDSRGRNIALWVGSALAYRWRTRAPRETEYTFAAALPDRARAAA